MDILIGILMGIIMGILMCTVLGIFIVSTNYVSLCVCTNIYIYIDTTQ